VQVTAFVEEVLRYDSPVQMTSRRAAAPASVGGRPVTPADEIIVMLGASNRDPRRFAEPNRFNPARADGGPLSFGGGAHFCIGSALARLEAAVAFPQILARFPRIAAAGEPVRKDGLVLRGYESLPVVVA
jgi:cytochrome P450